MTRKLRSPDARHALHSSQPMIDLNISGPSMARSQYNSTPKTDFRSTAMSNFKNEKLNKVFIHDGDAHIHRLCTTVGNEGFMDWDSTQTVAAITGDVRKHNNSYSKSEWAQNYLQNVNTFVHDAKQIAAN